MISRLVSYILRLFKKQPEDIDEIEADEDCPYCGAALGRTFVTWKHECSPNEYNYIYVCGTWTMQTAGHECYISSQGYYCQKETFMSLYRAGKVADSDIEGFVNVWHSMTTKVLLHEWLGMTWNEYVYWVETNELPV